MKIERFIGGMLESNGYVIYQKDGGNCYVIDPGYHAGVFEECIDRHQLHLSGILLTHHHYDHVGAVEKLRDRYDAPVFMHTADCDQYHGRVDVYLEDGDTIDLDGETIRLIPPAYTGMISTITRPIMNLLIRWNTKVRRLSSWLWPGRAKTFTMS